MKLIEVIILALTVVLFFIGVHQTLLYGFYNSYWIFMFCIALLLFHQWRKSKNNASDKN
jgi:hypothetical protein